MKMVYTPLRWNQCEVKEQWTEMVYPLNLDNGYNVVIVNYTIADTVLRILQHPKIQNVVTRNSMKIQATNGQPTTQIKHSNTLDEKASKYPHFNLGPETHCWNLEGYILPESPFLLLSSFFQPMIKLLLLLYC